MLFIDKIIHILIMVNFENQTELNEFEWYLRDHIFKRYTKESVIDRNLLPREMVQTYFRYRNYDVARLNIICNDALTKLINDQVFCKIDDNNIQLVKSISRFQCITCHYINYLFNTEPRICKRCLSNELRDFVKKFNKNK